MILTAVYDPCPESDGYTCWITEMPEVTSAGSTLDEARNNLRDALAFMLDYRHDEAYAHVAPGAFIEELDLESIDISCSPSQGEILESEISDEKVFGGILDNALKMMEKGSVMIVDGKPEMVQMSPDALELYEKAMERRADELAEAILENDIWREIPDERVKKKWNTKLNERRIREAPKTLFEDYENYYRKRSTIAARSSQKKAIHGVTLLNRSSQIEMINSVCYAEILQTGKVPKSTTPLSEQLAECERVISEADPSRYEESIRSYQMYIASVISKAVLNADSSFFRGLIKELELGQELAKANPTMKTGEIVLPALALISNLKRDNGWGNMDIIHSVENHWFSTEFHGLTSRIVVGV